MSSAPRTFATRTLSLPEIHSSVDIPRTSVWRRLLAFAGPAYLVSVGYMDPGNWATDLEAGSAFGYQLLWVVVVSNAMALLLQTLSARLGVVAGKDLAQVCRSAYPKPVSYALWALCEVAIAACDLSEVLGAAIALNLLFQIPLLFGVLFTAADTLFLLWLQQSRIRALESTILRLILIISACLGIEIFLAKPAGVEIFHGLAPRLSNESLFVTIAILGATVMPHNLYLHSALVQSRRIGKGEENKKRACWYNLMDTTAALNAAMFVNIAILVLAAAVFFRHGVQVTDIQQATKLLEPMLDAKTASIIFAIALLCAGQASTITGTMAGQIVMEGFLQFRMRPWLRRLSTRLLAIVPAAFMVYFRGGSGAYQLLLLGQVVLSLQLPFAVIPLIRFTSDRRRMGTFANGFWLKLSAWTAAAASVGLNLAFAGSHLQQWFADAGRYRAAIQFIGIPGFAGLLGLLLYISVAPSADRTASAETGINHGTADEGDIADAEILDAVEWDGHLSETRFEAFMNHLHGLAFIKNTAGEYVYFNAASAGLMGLEAGGVISRRDADIWPARVAESMKKNDEKVLRSGKPFEAVETIPHAGIDHSWIVYRFPIIERETGSMFLGGVGVDISGRAAIEQQLVERRKAEAVGRLASGFAHHFNNLLTIIMGYSQIARDRLPDHDPARADLDLVLNASNRAAMLTEQILAFSSRQMLHLRDVNIHQLLLEMHSILEHIAQPLELAIRTGAESPVVRADASCIERVILTLSLNARDAMEQTGGRLSIVTSNVEHDGRIFIRLSVSDTGTGMDDLTKSRLFEPFFSGKNTPTATGMGLSSAYGTARQHGGWISVDTELGVGSAFHLHLPVKLNA